MNLKPARQLLPGIAICLSVAIAAMLLSGILPQVSPLLLSILAGVVATNVLPLSDTLGPGISFTSKKFLRLGIVFLGLKVALTDIASLGLPVLVLVTAIVGFGIISTFLLGRMLGINQKLTLLIGCGFSICGAAAVAGVEGVVEADEEDVVTAVALVVVFGTLMIPLLPAAGFMLGLSTTAHGIWAGASVHEVAQVVAAGEIIGDQALQIAVITKLARVLLLAPVVIILGLILRQPKDKTTPSPPLVPAFIVGFLAMVLLRSTGILPEAWIEIGALLQTVLLSAAMFALGLGVKVSSLKKLGFKPFLLASLSTGIIVTLAGLGVAIVQ